MLEKITDGSIYVIDEHQDMRSVVIGGRLYLVVSNPNGVAIEPVCSYAGTLPRRQNKPTKTIEDIVKNIRDN